MPFGVGPWKGHIACLEPVGIPLIAGGVAAAVGSVFVEYLGPDYFALTALSYGLGIAGGVNVTVGVVKAVVGRVLIKTAQPRFGARPELHLHLAPTRVALTFRW